MEEIIKKLDTLDAKVGALDAKVEKIDRRLDEHDKKFEEHASQIDLLAITVADHTERLDRIEIKLDSVATDVTKIVGTLDGLAKLINRHDEEIVAINYNHKILDRRVEVLEHKI